MESGGYTLLGIIIVYWVLELYKKHGLNYKYYPQQSLAKSRNGGQNLSIGATIAQSIIIRHDTGSILKVVFEYKPQVSSTTRAIPI